jgi:hypothetical protein
MSWSELERCVDDVEADTAVQRASGTAAPAGS